MRRSLSLLALVVLVGVFADRVWAQDRAARIAVEALAAEAQARVVPVDTLLRFRTRAVPGGRIDVDEGVFRAAYRIGRRVTPEASHEAMARAYLTAEADRFGWTRVDDDLALETVVQGRYSTHVTYQQTFYSLPVYNRLVKVNLNRDGQPTMVTSSYAPHLARAGVFNPTPSLSTAAAETRAQALVSARGARTSTPELVVYPSEIPRLAWRLLAWPDGLAAEWQVLIDAHTGEVILLFDQSTHAHVFDERENGRMGAWERASNSSPLSPSPPLPLPPSSQPLARVDGTGLVFDPDPLTTAGVEYGAPYVDANDADVAELNAERIEVTLHDITLGTDGLYRLEGPYVAIDGAATIGGSGSTPPAEADPTAFQYTRANDFFEAVMAYYHVDKSQRYVQSLDVGRPIQEVAVRVNPHGLGNSDDSRYYPGLNGMAFGDGGIDDAEDADVIWHEYGHALLQSSAPGLLNSDEGRALHEGWADYWAASYSRGLIEAGKVPARDWRKVFTWDGNNGSWQGRMLDNEGIYPVDTRCDNGPCGSAIYSDGLLWATTTMEIYDAVGREVADRLSLASHVYLSPPTTFADAAEALIQADLDLYGGEHLGVIIDRLGTRGLIDPSSFGPLVSHEPIPHVEEQSGLVTFDVSALSVSAPVASVSLFYSINGGTFDVFQLDPQGEDRYSGTLTLPAEATEVAYYLEAADMSGLRTLLPVGAPQNTFTFSVGQDTEAPVITHEPLEIVAIQTWPATITATVDDNQGVDSVWVSFVSNRPDGTTVTEGAFGLERDEEQFVGDFPVPVEILQENHRVRYRLHAVDVATNANEALLPAAGEPAFEFTLVIEGVLASYDFETDQGIESIGVWVRGAPTFGVQVAHSGQNVWATGVDVPYPATVHRSSLDLPPLNLDQLNKAYLVFWHWYDFEHSGFIEPGQDTSGVLWDGGNVKVSTNDGASWEVAEPLGGYNGALETGAGNPLQGERAFGGYSFGWRRVIVPLPVDETVRIRFDFGTDGSNELQTLFYAGWYLDDVRVVTELPPADTTPPALVAAPPALTFADAGRVPQPLVAQVTDDIGIEAVLAEYQIVKASGARQPGVLRLGMSPTDLTTYLGTIPTPDPLTVGDAIEYRLRLRDFDGNTTLFPATSEAPLRIQYRLTESADALGGVRASGLWESRGRNWSVIPSDSPLAPRSSLVLEPIDLPGNTEEIALTLIHSYRFGSDLGGNLKLSLDGGASWTVLTPEGGYGASYDPEGTHPMSGEQVFAGQAANDVAATFDLSQYAGRQIRLRIDFGATRALQATEFWQIAQAALVTSTLDPTFDVPRTLALHPNFPDPFSDNTTISYTVPETMPVLLEMYNVLGQRISVLVDGEQPAGTYTLTLGRGGLASGVYLLRMMAGGAQHIERMVIAR